MWKKNEEWESNLCMRFFHYIPTLELMSPISLWRPVSCCIIDVTNIALPCNQLTRDVSYLSQHISQSWIQKVGAKIDTNNRCFNYLGSPRLKWRPFCLYYSDTDEPGWMTECIFNVLIRLFLFLQLFTLNWVQGYFPFCSVLLNIKEQTA